MINPLEVVPELDCDITKKKGEKIDYAIMKDSAAAMLVECKHWKQDLTLHDTQLKRYFVASNARFGILTNGIEYRFYTDLEKQNIMDERPFMVVNLLDLSDADVEQLKKFHKSYYNEEDILSTTQELKYTTELSGILTTEFNTPSIEFVKFFTKQVYEGQVNQKIVDQFTPLIKKAITTIINDTITDRLGLAIKNSKEEIAPVDSAPAIPTTEKESQNLPDGVVFQSEDGSIITTQEEIDSYLIVKAILRPVIDVSRVYYRDAQSYFAILLDDNNRKPICRMILNRKSVKYIVLFDENKAETKYTIQSLDDIYNFTDQIRDTVLRYINK